MERRSKLSDRQIGAAADHALRHPSAGDSGTLGTTGELRRAILAELAELLEPDQVERARGLELEDLVELLRSLTPAAG